MQAINMLEHEKYCDIKKTENYKIKSGQLILLRT